MMKSILHIFGNLKRRILVLWDKYMAAYGVAVKNGYKSNAFSPIAFYAYFLILPLIGAAVWIHNFVLQCIFVAVIVIIALFPLVMYLLLFKKDPRLLQSEKFRLEEKKLNMIAEKGGSIKISEVDLNNNTRIGGDGD